MAKKVELGDHIACPYCGRRGVVSRIFKHDKSISYNVTHKVVAGKVKSEASGKLIPCEVLVEACHQGEKVDAWDRLEAEDEW